MMEVKLFFFPGLFLGYEFLTIEDGLAITGVVWKNIMEFVVHLILILKLKVIYVRDSIYVGTRE
jgi:hypothetical protein